MFEVYLRNIITMYESKSGERGIFNREAAKGQAIKSGRRDPNYDFGTNPCGEILLRSMQCCNLSEIIIRPDDSMVQLKVALNVRWSY